MSSKKDDEEDPKPKLERDDDIGESSKVKSISKLGTREQSLQQTGVPDYKDQVRSTTLAFSPGAIAVGAGCATARTKQHRKDPPGEFLSSKRDAPLLSKPGAHSAASGSARLKDDAVHDSSGIPLASVCDEDAQVDPMFKDQGRSDIVGDGSGRNGGPTFKDQVRNADPVDGSEEGTTARRDSSSHLIAATLVTDARTAIYVAVEQESQRKRTIKIVLAILFLVAAVIGGLFGGGVLGAESPTQPTIPESSSGDVPTNDRCEAAIPLLEGTVMNVSTVNATASEITSLELCGSAYDSGEPVLDLWYKVESPGHNQSVLTVSTCSGNVDLDTNDYYTQVVAYSGDNCDGTLTCLAGGGENIYVEGVCHYKGA